MYPSQFTRHRDRIVKEKQKQKANVKTSKPLNKLNEWNNRDID